MFEHSNIIRLRFSRTNFFYERTFVVARWSIFGSNSAERSFGLARGSHACKALLLKSCADACHVLWRAAEKVAVTWTFNLKRSMKDNPSKVSNTFYVAEIWNNSSVLRRASCALASSKQRQVTRKYLARSCLDDLRFVKIIHMHGKDYYTCSSCSRSLPSSQPIHTAQPHPHCSAPSDIKKVLVLDQLQASPCHWLRYGKVEQRRHLQPRLIGNPTASPIADQRAGSTGDFLGHAQEFVQRRVALSDRPLRAGGPEDHWSGAWPG